MEISGLANCSFLSFTPWVDVTVNGYMCKLPVLKNRYSNDDEEVKVIL